MPRVNADILQWARESAGLGREEAAARLGINEARGIPAIDRLAALEAGDAEPTRPVLLRMAKLYHRPLLTFYMAAPPRRGDRGEDFRTLPEDRSATADALLDALIRDVRARQSIVRAAMEDDGELEPRSFIGSKRVADGVEEVAASIRNTLQFRLEEFRRPRLADEAFTVLRRKVEAAGIFVLLAGNLGSHHTEIDLDTFRGFAVADPVAPFVVINDQDAKSAWSFTLLHEVAHLWLGQTGVSGARAERDIEKFCNDVAGELLLPAIELRALAIGNNTALQEAIDQIGQFANVRNLSRSMVAYKLYRSGNIRHDKWRELSTYFRQQWLADRIARRERGKESESGPNYYVVRRHRVGSALIDFVSRMTASGALTTSKAGKVLGVRAKNVHLLISTPAPDRARRA